MSVPVAKHQFTSGEISPAMLGRQDVERYGSGATTFRNFFINFTGPAYSRAGTLFCGFSKQTGRAYPPRLIEFQFSNNQGLAIEVGNQYMRFVSEGAYVTDVNAPIASITQANPMQISLVPSSLVASATANAAAVSGSYNSGDTIPLAGGTYVTQGVLQVASTALHSAAYANPGQGYAPGDAIVAAGGTASINAILSVGSTQVVNASVAGSTTGAGGTPNGYGVVQGTTGTGTKFTATVFIGASGHIQGATGIPPTILTGGSYTANPNLTNEPVVGISGNAIGITGAVLQLTVGIRTVGVTTPGVYTNNPSGGLLTQGSTSGAGTGATFSTIFAPLALTVQTPGVYSVFPTNPVSQASTSGSGVGATFNLTSGSVPLSLAIGDWLFVSGVSGMTQVNGKTVVISNVTGYTVTLEDVFGNPVNSTGYGAYVSGGQIQRIYTLATPYHEADIPYLKVVQSADTFSLCLVNQVTQTEYAPQDLTRTTDTNWAFSAVVPAPTVLPPTGLSGSASTSGTVDYNYQVTAVAMSDGTESIASATIDVPNAVAIASTAGSIKLNFTNISQGASEYYWYKALPSYGSVAVPVGSQFGYVGYSYGNSFVDSNITPDFTQAPPVHKNPFARGVILSAVPVTLGSGYSQSSIVVTINTTTGSGGVIEAVVSASGQVVGYLVLDQGENYGPNDTITITVGGTGATGKLNVGPQMGTYPSLPAYFQERRAYANTINNPDTYYFSQPGAFTNFDVRNPTIASDAVTGSPWAVQVNGVQWLIQTSGGLLVMTGLRAWMLVGAGSFATNVQPISPSNQNDVPQAFSGCSPLIQPQLVNYDVIYVDPNNVYYYDLPYQLYALSEPIDLTDISAHLFTGYSVVANAYCEKPWRIVWSVRSDGAVLSLTYYKTQKVQGWGRHDTQGYFVSTCSVTEAPVNAAYFATQRFFPEGNAYCIERMDNRIWPDVEAVWAVDCGLAYPQPQPAATLSISSATGLGSVTGVTGLVGGAGYSPQTAATVADDFNGSGTGAVGTVTVVGGVITSVAFLGGSQGQNYTHPKITFSDPAGSVGGSGASARAVLNNATTLTSNPGVFSLSSVGSVVRAGGGIATITGYTSPTLVTANVNVPFPQVVPNSGGALPVIPAGGWTMTAPVSSVQAPHLAGMTVTGLADGNVIPPTVADANGVITLAVPASAIVVGLGFQAQFQDVPIDLGNPTQQGQRKNLTATTLRIEASRGVKVGANQRDGSSLSPMQLATTWNNMIPIPETPQGGAVNFPPAPHNSLATPLLTGDVRLALINGLGTPGQLCVQQDYPLPCQITAIYSEVLPGDTVQTMAPKQQGKAQQ